MFQEMPVLSGGGGGGYSQIVAYGLSINDSTKMDTSDNMATDVFALSFNSNKTVATLTFAKATKGVVCGQYRVTVSGTADYSAFNGNSTTTGEFDADVGEMLILSASGNWPSFIIVITQ